ncbi:E3 ubiquitin-protein ligase RNF182-like [Conger conger]|uniref:E3 ubiquitin-protein ligase RNF182-like n=1 Tax=Conger conger TaxID=82655 RepID=UPI002A5ACE1B|nr:E3 ubiquitin-protein ligase RNF182-like [Conger conger]
MMGQAPQDAPEVLGAEELECKICYYRYNLSVRRPKVLDCGHRLCAKCLNKILDLGESPPRAVVCPFCRCATSLPEEEEEEEEAGDASGLPDDRGLVAALALRLQNRRNLLEGSTELLLSPRRLSALVGPSSSSSSPSSRRAPSCLVITIVESAQDSPPGSPRAPAHGRARRSPSLDSMTSMAQRWTVWNCTSLLCQASAQALIWLLGLLYFSSLPLGVYLLIVQKTTLGVLLVSLVPSSLVLVMAYGLSRCLCRELLDCMST